MSQPIDPADDIPPSTPSAPTGSHPAPPTPLEYDNSPPEKRPFYRRFFSDKLALAFSTYFALTLRIATTMIMARILTREDYGLYGLVMLAPALIVSWGDIFIPTIVVQIRDKEEREVFDSAILIISILALIYFLSYITGGIYLYSFSKVAHSDFRVLVLAPLIGAVTVASMLYTTQLAILNRRAARGAESLQNIIFSLVQASTGIGFALLSKRLGRPEYGVFALALQTLIGQIVANLAIWRHAPPRWPRYHTRDTIKRMLSLASIASIGNYIGVLETYIFNYIIVRSSPTSALAQTRLGEWTQAVKVQQLFAQNLGAALDKVVYTTLCAVQDNSTQMREISRRALETLLMFNCFAAAWILVLSQDIVRIVLGLKWADIVPSLSVLALAIPAGGIYTVANMVCFAAGKTMPLTKWSVIRFILVVASFFLIPSHGLVAVAWVWTVSRTAHAIATLMESWKFSGRPPRVSFVHLALILAAALACSFAMFASRDALTSVNPLLRLSACSLIGLATYGILLFLLIPDAVRYLLRMAKGR